MHKDLYNLLENFPDFIDVLSPLCDNTPHYLKVTDNGEICYDTKERVFDVWDETYAYKIGTTSYPLVAYHMLESYGENYLG